MLIIYTPYGDVYKVNDKDEIAKRDSDFSGKWLFLGLSHVKRNEFIPTGRITRELLKSLELTYKNGNPQWTVRDLDHGTTGEWGNTRVHGVKGMYFADK